MTKAAGTGTEATASRKAALEEALQAFKNGRTSLEELLNRVDSLARSDSASLLLTALDAIQASAPLSPDLYQRLARRIDSDAPTIVLSDAGHQDETPRAARASARRPTVAVGDVLQARFRLIELIGEGGMSRVYKAVDLRRVEAGSQDPHIAVKVLTLPFDQHFGSIAALQSEAQKLQGLSHPNIVRVFDCDRDGEIVFMTMEYLAGTTLLSGHPSRREAHDVGGQTAHAILMAVADALRYAHSKQIVHGDLKPGNVLVTDRGEVKVIDFGIARWIAQPEAAVERREAVQNKLALAVTRRYASPQVMARQLPEPADDVYALACLAYLLLTGSHPFANDQALAAKTPPPRLPGLTQTEYEAILNGLRYDRDARTSTVTQFVEEFTKLSPAAKGTRPALWLTALAFALAAVWLVGQRFHWAERFRASPSSAQPARPALSSSAATMPGTPIHDCETCPGATVLPSGQFEQGSAAGTSAFEQPQHLVRIDHPLAMTTYEVTVGEFAQFVAATGRDMQGCDTYDGRWLYHANHSWKDPGFTQETNHPVTCTSWSDAVAYAGWLSVKSGHHYRLPSASEWEYAARASISAATGVRASDAVAETSANAPDTCGVANVADLSAAKRYAGWDVFMCDDHYVNTAPVGSFKANAFGLHDMLGNVFEWTQDCWNASYEGAPTDGGARTDGDCSEHELRGGSWFSSPASVTVSYRDHFPADYRTSSVGIRLVRELNP